MTAYRTEGVVLTRDADTLDLRTRAVEAGRWDGLMGPPPMFVATQALPDFDGLELGPISSGGITARLTIDVDGRFNIDGTTAADRRENAYSLVATVNDFIGTTAACTVTVHRLGSLADVEGTLVFVDPGPPLWRAGHLVRFETQVLLPDGQLVAAA